MGSDVRLIIHYAEVEIRAMAERLVNHCMVDCIGPFDVTPSCLAVWVKTKTDQERDLLIASPGLQDELRHVFRLRGYPEVAIPTIAFAFQSQETVERDFKGDWGLAIR